MGSQAYKSNPITFGFTVTFCIIFAVLVLFTAFAMYLQFQRLVLGDALKKAEEENSESQESSDYSVTDSNQDIDKEESSSSSSESQDTLDEYGFPNENKKHIENFLFQDDYDPDIADNDDDTDIDDQYKSDIDSKHSNAPDPE